MDMLARVEVGRDESRGGRLVLAMRRAGCKRAELAHLLAISERQLSRYRSGDPIPAELLPAICARCEISAEFLLFGRLPDAPAATLGPMMKDTLNTQMEIRETLLVNGVPLHRLHLRLLRHLRRLRDESYACAVDRILSSRWRGEVEPFRGEAPVLDGVALDRYELAVVLTLRSFSSVPLEVDLIQHVISSWWAE